MSKLRFRGSVTYLKYKDSNLGGADSKAFPLHLPLSREKVRKLQRPMHPPPRADRPHLWAVKPHCPVLSASGPFFPPKGEAGSDQTAERGRDPRSPSPTPHPQRNLLPSVWGHSSYTEQVLNSWHHSICIALQPCSLPLPLIWFCAPPMI